MSMMCQVHVCTHDVSSTCMYALCVVGVSVLIEFFSSLSCLVQVDKVEMFKNTLSKEHCLHAKYSISKGCLYNTIVQDCSRLSLSFVNTHNFV